MTVNELRDQLGGLDPFHCDQVRQMAVTALLSAPGYDVVRRLYKRDHENGEHPTADWLESLRCQLESGGMDYGAAGRLDLERFAAAIENLRTTYKTDADTIRSCPLWNSDTKTLSFNGHNRKFSEQAKNVCVVLDAFQEDGWPERLDDPDPRGEDPVRVQNTVATLNKQPIGIKFSTGDGGQSYVWKADIEN